MQFLISRGKKKTRERIRRNMENRTENQDRSFKKNERREREASGIGIVTENQNPMKMGSMLP